MSIYDGVRHSYKGWDLAVNATVTNSSPPQSIHDRGEQTINQTKSIQIISAGEKSLIGKGNK